MALNPYSSAQPLLLADFWLLVVGDDEFSRELVTSLLERAGATVVTATSAHELGQVMGQITPSLIFCTIQKRRDSEEAYIETI